jgi:hypothetical protein
LRPGELLETWSELSAVRTLRAGTQVVMSFEQFDSEGCLAVQQWWTMILLGCDGVGDPGRVRRVAVRFAAPTPLGADLTVDTYGIDEHAFAFEASCGDAGVISHGRLELQPWPT